jgi:SAM-dependent methyltransferase
MAREYDQTIKKHYQQVAEEFGLLATSTMADEITRELESQAVLHFISESLGIRQAEGESAPALIMDVGCGNGYTLERLSEKYPDQRFVGIEKSDEMRSLASARFARHENVEILKGDIRDRDFAPKASVDILVCQRVLINLLNERDQKAALSNIINVVAPSSIMRSGGTLLFIESFSNSLAKLNEARAEFELPAISPAHHNLYLAHDFFDSPQLKPFHGASHLPPPNFLSTHYFVTRVLHPVFLGDKPLKRNSEFVRFFSGALKENQGDYSPLKLYMFGKTETAG